MGCVDGLQLLRYCSAPALEKKQLNDSLTDMSIDRFGQLIISAWWRIEVLSSDFFFHL